MEKFEMPAKKLFSHLAAFLILVAVGSAAASESKDGEISLPIPEMGDDGLHKQAWFEETFLDLNEDLAEAKSQGKRLVIIWEQRGCPYCKKTYEINFRIPRISNYVKDNFLVLQLNMWGDREVTDFDGEVLPEKDFARKNRVLFTPTFQFFTDNPKEAAGNPAWRAEVHRMPGFFWPFHFYFQFRYVKEMAYIEQPSFQRWLDGQGEKLQKAGMNVEEALHEESLHLPEGFN
jgi:thioredoxin-related protein